MGQLTDLQIAAWQKRAGIEPATGDRANLLEQLSQAAFRLIKTIELERSGIRDGDGHWYGCGAMEEEAQEVINLYYLLTGTPKAVAFNDDAYDFQPF